VCYTIGTRARTWRPAASASGAQPHPPPCALTVCRATSAHHCNERRCGALVPAVMHAAAATQTRCSLVSVPSLTSEAHSQPGQPHHCTQRTRVRSALSALEPAGNPRPASAARESMARARRGATRAKAAGALRTLLLCKLVSLWSYHCGREATRGAREQEVMAAPGIAPPRQTFARGKFRRRGCRACPDCFRACRLQPRRRCGARGQSLTKCWRRCRGTTSSTTLCSGQLQVFRNNKIDRSQSGCPWRTLVVCYLREVDCLLPGNPPLLASQVRSRLPC